MAVVTRGLVNRGDLALWDGINATVERVDATGGTITALAVGVAVDVLQVYGAGTSRTAGTIASAIARIGSSNVTLEFSPGTWTIDANTTIPSNLTCIIPAGCVFAVSSGFTLTFSGEVIIENPTWYSGLGTVVVSQIGIHGSIYHRTAAERSASITPTNLRYPQGHVLRYGTNTTPGTTDMATAINNAVLVMVAHGGGDVVYPPETVRIASTISSAAKVNHVGEGYASKILADNCNAITLDFETAFGQVRIANLFIQGTNGTTRFAIYQPGTLDDADELFGISLEGLLITDFHKCISTRSVRMFHIERCWLQDCNQAMDLKGKNLVVRITNTTCVKGDSNGTTTGGGTASSDNICLLLDYFNFTSGTGNVAPEGVIVQASQFYGFDVGVKALAANYVAISQLDMDARVYGLLFETVQQGLTFRDSTIVMQATTSLAAVKGNGLASALATRIRIHSIDVVGSTATNCIGVHIHDANQNQNHISIKDNYFSGMGVNDILLNNAGPGMYVRDNRCNSSSPTNSISVPNVVSGGKVYIDGNHCLKAINAVAEELANGEVVLGPNVTADSTFSPGYARLRTVDTLTGAGAVILTTITTKLVTTGANALTLADGVEGQRKTIFMITDGGDGTLTPTNLFNGTTITFNDVGDCVELLFTGADWHILSNTGATVA